MQLIMCMQRSDPIYLGLRIMLFFVRVSNNVLSCSLFLSSGRNLLLDRLPNGSTSSRATRSMYNRLFVCFYGGPSPHISSRCRSLFLMFDTCYHLLLCVCSCFRVFVFLNITQTYYKTNSPHSRIVHSYNNLHNLANPKRDLR
jgi:hypothetical protein